MAERLRISTSRLQIAPRGAPRITFVAPKILKGPARDTYYKQVELYWRILGAMSYAEDGTPIHRKLESALDLIGEDAKCKRHSRLACKECYKV